METLKIKNFFPVADADIEVKPLTVFIGESASGKSIILKLLSLFRWIHKKVSLRELTKSVGSGERFRIEKMLRDSGLEDFCVKGSVAEYTTDDFSARITCNGKPRLKIDLLNKKIPFTLEKISFVSDDRFSIPLLLNNQIRATTIPFHLEKTFEDFSVAFDALSAAANKKVKIETFNAELLKEKYGIQQRFLIKKGGTSTPLHNASSGIKSVSTIEIIAKHFANDTEYMQSGLNSYLVGLFATLKEKDPAAFVNKIKNAEFNKARFSLFIEEPELSLFPNAQKTLIEYLVRLCFNQTEKDIQLAFSTHSPYILSMLNALLLAHQIGTAGDTAQKERVSEIVPENLWLDVQKFNAYIIRNGRAERIIDEENSLRAEEIDGASAEIDDIIENLFGIQYP